MLFRFLSTLVHETAKESDDKGKQKKKLTQAEKDKREYELWVAAEEFKEEE